jgi:Protein of unknown function (DUF3619)
MDEKEFAQKITRTLDWGTSQIDGDKLAKLRNARQAAMKNYREPVNVLGLVTVSGQTLDVSNWIRKPLFWLPILAVVAALVTVNVMDDDVADEAGELDAKLLTGELPIDAFLDKDFGSWVKDSSR